MDNEASATSGDRRSSATSGEGGRDETGVDPVAFGKAVGFAAGFLSFFAIAYGWDLGLPYPMTLFCIFSGWLLVLVFYIVRAGGIREMYRDKACKYILLLGTCAGMFVGRLDFLAAWNGWDEVEFGGLDWPVSLMWPFWKWFHSLGVLPALPEDPRLSILYEHAMAMVYWTVVGLLIASFFCAMRIRKKRKRAGEVRES
jgi:hypothetical protein